MAASAPDLNEVLQQVPEYLRQTPYAALLLRTPENKRNALMVPTEWNLKDKVEGLTVIHNNLQVNYSGPGMRDSDAASIRANRSIPSQCGVYYYEITVVDKGHDGFIGLGVCHSGVLAGRLPGWEANSWGYHGDDGNCFAGSGSGRPYGPKFTTDDVVGCCVNTWTQQIFFTKNGVRLYTAFRNVKGALYPTVGLRTKDEKVLANFGQKPFQFDIQGYYTEEKHRLWRSIKGGPLPSLPTVPETGLLAALHTAPQTPMVKPSTKDSDKMYNEVDYTNDLILSYFIHHGYRESARAFVQNVLGTASTQRAHAVLVNGKTSPSDQSSFGDNANLSLDRALKDLDRQDAELEIRQRISQCVLRGDIDQAIQLTRTHYPEVLCDNELMCFQLRCQKFVELIRRSGGAQTVDKLDENFVAGFDAPSDDAMETEESATGLTLADTAPSGEKLAKAPASSEESAVTAGNALREALRCGRQLRMDYGEDRRKVVVDTLDNIFSLLAYPEPVHSPVAYLLDEQKRKELVHSLNEEILVAQNKPRVPPLERAFTQTKVGIDELINQGSPTANFVQVEHDLLT
ncbi:hypothetical protein IWQ62_005936 [Dispira parvispora]|uniref:Uncharacterized protein n=1 Tax=Dispira parvispora TaxID=1520584 RepID=A0A9W8E0J7_9FUNG|nr:hypothetical protein IWQ62_005936 [Dispira parvispora]